MNEIDKRYESRYGKSNPSTPRRIKAQLDGHEDAEQMHELLDADEFNPGWREYLMKTKGPVRFID